MVMERTTTVSGLWNFLSMVNVFLSRRREIHHRWIKHTTALLPRVTRSKVRTNLTSCALLVILLVQLLISGQWFMSSFNVWRTLYLTLESTPFGHVISFQEQACPSKIWCEKISPYLLAGQTFKAEEDVTPIDVYQMMPGWWKAMMVGQRDIMEMLIYQHEDKFKVRCLWRYKKDYPLLYPLLTFVEGIFFTLWDINIYYVSQCY